MNCLVLIFSKDRALQLDATLRSLLEHCSDISTSKICVLFTASNISHENQYSQLRNDFQPSSYIKFIREENFHSDVIALLAPYDYVLFLVDDNIFVRDFSLAEVTKTLEAHSDAIGFSLRLGENTTYCYPLDKEQHLPDFQPLGHNVLKYNWTSAEHDFGYPLELSSSAYRTEDMVSFIAGLPFENPNTLESLMAANASFFGQSKPFLLCFDRSVTFCIPLNKVQYVFTANRTIDRTEYSAANLAKLFSDGYRIDIASYQDLAPNGCHQEVELKLVSPAKAPREKEPREEPPTVSVIIPCYNQAQYLSEAVESVVNQTYEDWECIIVKDGSPDNTSEVARKLIAQYPHKRIILLEKKNGGLADARNFGIGNAKGKYILPLDADDKIQPEMLQKTVELLQARPNVAIVYTDTVRFGKVNNTYQTSDFSVATLCSYNPINYCSLYRREVWEAAGGYRTNMVHGYEDWDFWISCAEKGFTGQRIPEYLFMYRIKEDSMLSKAYERDADLKAQIVLNHPRLYDQATIEWARSLKSKMGEQQFPKKKQKDSPSSILLVVHNFPVHRMSGTELYAYSLAQELRHRGNTVRLLYPVFDQTQPQGAVSEYPYEGLSVARINIHPSPDLVHEFRNEEAAAGFRKYLQGLTADIVHFHHLYGISASALEVCYQMGIPTVMTLHDEWLLCEEMHYMKDGKTFCDKGPETVDKCVQCFMKRHPGISSPENIPTLFYAFSFRRQFLREALKQINTLIVPTRFLQEALKTHNFLHPDNRLVPLGLSPFQPLPYDRYERWLRFTYLGNITFTKGLDVAIAAFNTLQGDDVHLDIYGAIQKQAYFEQEMAGLRKGVVVNYHGPYMPDDLPGILAKTDIAVIPSRSENYPFVVRECLHADVPVIASNVGGIPEIIRDGEDGLLFNPGDSKDLADKIRFFVQNPEKIAEFRRNIKPVRTIADDADQLQNIYKEALTYKPASEKIKDASRTERHKPISIIIVTYNSAPTLRACLDSVIEHTPGAEIIVVDNASTDDTGSILEEYKAGERIKVILNDENKGFSYACNQGIRASTGEYIVLLNPDTIVTPNWSDHLIAHFKPGIGAVGPVSNYVAGLQKVEIYSGEPLQGKSGIGELSQKLYKRNKGQGRETKLLIGFCMALSQKALKEVGLLDESLFLGNDDLDISWRLREHGYKLIVATDTFVYHEGQVSFGSAEKFNTTALVQESTDRLYAKLVSRYGKNNVPPPQELWGIDWFRPSQASFRKESFSRVEPLTSIIILTLNQLAHTRLCIESIKKHTPEPHEIIIVDNGSTDGTLEYLKGEIATGSNMSVISNNTNRGFAAGNNQGISLAQGEYVLLLNNDTIVTAGWLGHMTNIFKRHPRTGIVGPMSNNVTRPQIIEKVGYEGIEGIDDFAASLARTYEGQNFTTLKASGFCLLAKRKVIDTIGGLDERFGSGNYEDDDFNLRAFYAGFEIRIAMDVFIHHTGKITFSGLGVDYTESLGHNWDLFKEKWSIPKDRQRGDYTLPSPLRISSYVPLPNVSSDHTLDPAGNWWTETGYKETEHREKVKAEGKERIKGLTSIIVLLTSQREHARKCVESIEKHTREPHEIIFVPRNIPYSSPKWLRKLLKEKKDYKLATTADLMGQPNAMVSLSNHDTSTTLTYAQACNLGITESNGEYIAILHGAAVVTDDWLSGMLECLKSSYDAGVVGPMAINIDGPQGIRIDSTPLSLESPNPALEDIDAFAAEFKERHRHRRVVVGSLDSFCLVFKHKLTESTGLFDAQFETDEYAGNDFCFSVAAEGYKSLIAGDVFIHYHGGAGLPALKDNIAFSKKWGDVDESNPESQKIYCTNALLLSEELYEKGQKEKAITVLIEGIKSYPDEERLHYALAQLLLDEKKYAEALEILARMPEGRKPASWQDVKREGVETWKTRDIRKLELTGSCKEGLGFDEEAIGIADEILARDNASAKAWNLKGAVSFKKGLSADAARYFNEALEADRAFGEAYSNLGALAWMAGDNEKAFALFEKGVILSPTLGDVVTNYYTAAVSLSRLPEAERAFREAIALHPSNRRLKFILTDNLLQQKKFKEAMTTMEEGLDTFGIDDDTLTVASKLRDTVGSMEIRSKKDSRRPSVSLCMIVKDEEKNIVRSLMAARPLVDEMIVVDTGSSDRTKKIAKVFGAKVYDFPWTGDFSAARNFSLSKASGDWILVLDADEVIASSDYGRLKELVTPPSPPLAKGRHTFTPSLDKGGQGGVIAYSFTTRNYVEPISMNWQSNEGKYKEERGSGWFPSSKVRLFPNDNRIRFERPVHEMAEDSIRRIGMEIKPCEIPVHHYGKLSTEKARAKGEEYYQLGKKKLAEQGEQNANALYEFAMQASELEKYDEAAEYWKKLIRLIPGLEKAHHGLGTCYFQLGRYEEARESFIRAMRTGPGQKDQVVMYATTELLAGHADVAVSHLEEMLKNNPSYPLGLLAITAALFCAGRKEEGLEYLRKLERTQFILASYFKDIAKLLISVERYDYATALLEATVETNNTSEEMKQLLEECRELQRPRIQGAKDSVRILKKNS
jgi:GT2 family glycosyltransferase/glycosyltransferase involved in cell wall biosynthesis/predicted Zn-dependent protease